MPALDNLSRVADVSFTVARRAGSLAVSAVRQVADMAFERRSQSRTRTRWTPPPPVSGAPSSTPPRQPQPPAPAPAPGRPPSPEPSAGAAPVPTPAATAQPAAPEAEVETADDHVSREAVLVAESADAGAGNGAGAQIRVDEPWEGYGKLTAKEVNDRLATASPESLTVARLYEAAHRNRVTVLREIDRRLAAGD